MKKKLLIIFSILVACSGTWMWFAPRVRLDLTARNFDPSKLKLRRVDLMHKSWMSLPNGIEAGLLHLSDGTDVKYWFISGHDQPGSGTTRFDSMDGKTTYLHGCFCCEVWLPRLENWNELEKYVAKWDGSPP